MSAPGDAARLVAAAHLAARAHAGQRRKGGEIPYVNHVLEVADMVAADGWDADVVCAALLHDVVEDTAWTDEDLRARFGGRVADLVRWLTDDPAWEELPRAERKRRQAGHLGGAPREAQAIKIADQTSNVRDVGRLPAGWEPGEAAAYAAESEGMVDACRGASPGLAALFDAALAEARAHVAREEAA